MGGECPTPYTPECGTRRAPGAPSCRPHSAQHQLARACAVGLVTASTPAAPAPGKNGQQALGTCSNDGKMGKGYCTTPDTTHRRTRRPPLGALLPPTKRTTPAHKSVHCRVGDGPHARNPGAKRNRAASPGRSPQDRQMGEGECPTPDMRRRGTRRPPLGALLPLAQCTTQAHKSVPCVAGDGPPRLQPPAPKEKGQRAPAACPKDGRMGEVECPTPKYPHGGTRCSRLGAVLPPREHTTPAITSVRSGVVDGPPHPQGKRATVPSACPKDQRLGQGERPTPETPLRGTRRPPPLGALLPPPQRITPARRSLRCGVGFGATVPPPALPSEGGQPSPAACPKDGRF